MLTDHGSVALLPFLEKLRDTFASRGKELIDSSTRDRAEVRKRFAAQDQIASKWARRRFRFWKAKTPQSRLATEMSTCTNLAVEVRARQAIGKLLVSLSGLADDIASQARENCKVAAKKLLDCERIRDESRSGQRITTDSLAEIDVASPSTDRQLFSRFRPEWTQLGPNGDSRADWLLHLFTDPNLFENFRQETKRSFVRSLRSVTVVDVLADQLANPGTSDIAKAKIREAMQGTQPQWQAEIGINGIQFDDSLIAGLPLAAVEENRSLVVKEMMSMAAGINPNNQYRSTPCHVESGDKQTIYIIRKSSGACWHYLDEIADCFAAYQEWMQTGGHPVHIFGRETVMKMPPLLPQPKPTESEMALAIGLAYGFIAQRGPKYYANLIVDDEGTFQCPLATHWPSIDSRAVPEELTPLSTLVDHQRVVFGLGNELERSNQMGNSIRSVAAALAEDSHLITLINEAFSEMRELTTDEEIAEELTRHTIALMPEARRHSRESRAFQKIVDTLTYVANDLR